MVKLCSAIANLHVVLLFCCVCGVCCVCPQYGPALPCTAPHLIVFCRYGAWVVPRTAGLSSRAFVTFTILPSLRAVRISGQLTQPPASSITSCLVSDRNSINSNFIFDLGLSWPFAKGVPLSPLQLQLLNAGRLVVTIFTQLFPSGELQGTLEQLSCYDAAGSEFPGGKSVRMRCLVFRLTFCSWFRPCSCCCVSSA